MKLKLIGSVMLFAAIVGGAFFGYKKLKIATWYKEEKGTYKDDLGTNHAPALPLVKSLSQSEIELITASIISGRGNWNDDEEQILEGFLQLQTQKDYANFVRFFELTAKVTVEYWLLEVFTVDEEEYKVISKHLKRLQ